MAKKLGMPYNSKDLLLLFLWSLHVFAGNFMVSLKYYCTTIALCHSFHGQPEAQGMG